ncbi:MAG: C45 family autoproteolytic acyltransferase/hydrolase [Planctomycetota bacterium]|nr:C45 family autoproteolytic acyltransferase/hydrolase [Planctomycetota bacterium]
MDRFPFYRAEGTHRELGRQHGEQAKRQIAAHLDFMGSSLMLSREELRRRAMQFQPLFAQHCPHLVEEIEGLGEGAGVAFADALAVNIRSALTKASDGGCTSFVVARRGTRKGQILIGQNSDMLPAAMEFCYVLHLKPEDKPETLMWTFGGMIGYHGINGHGVGNFANDLGGGPEPCFAMPHYPVKRLMMECAAVDEVVQLLHSIKLWCNGNYVLCDGRGTILDVEATPGGPHLLTDNKSGFIAHSNHFVCAKHATHENHKVSAVDSFSRLARMNELVESRFGDLTVDDFKTFLRDRDGDPSGICRFAQTADPAADWMTAGMTIASIIAEPDKRRIHVAAGNKPETPYEVYKMNEHD